MNYPHFGGAEPSLRLDVLERAARHWQRGVIYTNGTVFIPPASPFMIHISVWGLGQEDAASRGAEVLHTALRLYQNDRRTVVVMTLNRRNLDQIGAVARLCRDHNLPLTFNLYTPTRDYRRKLDGQSPHDPKGTYRFGTPANNLMFNAQDLPRSRAAVAQALRDHPQTVRYAPLFNDQVHRPGPLFALDPATGMARDCRVLHDKRQRSHRPDLSFDPTACCFPNFDCATCRVYPPLYAKILFEGGRHLRDETTLRRWIEVYETWSRIHLPGWDQPSWDQQV